MSNRVFLTWNDHRRSRNLAPAFGAEYICLESRLPYLFRVIVLGIRTSWLLIVRRPDLVISQNPSLALAALCCALKPVLGFLLVVDRHSNFKLESLDSTKLKMRLFHAISRWSTRQADMTIVTNANLCALVDSWGGNGFVLPDRLPGMTTKACWQNSGPEPFVAVFIASFDDDEPLGDVLEGARRASSLFHLYITGNYKKAGVVPSARDQNVTFTGFLSEDMYVALLERADLVVVLTSEDDLLNCGAYEAVALGKPMMLSDKQAIRKYFDRGAMYVDNSADSIGHALATFPDVRDQLVSEVQALRAKLESDWSKTLALVLDALVLADQSPQSEDR